MVYLSLFFLFVYLFGAYAYGAATVYGLRDLNSTWSAGRLVSGTKQSADRAGLGLFAISTIWFVVHVLIEFRNLTGDTQESLLDLGMFIVFAFPPAIMHLVYVETQIEDEAAPPPIFKRLMQLNYVLSPAVGLVAIAWIFEILPRPDDLGAVIGGSIGALFIFSSIYSTALIMRRKRPGRTASQLQLRRVMIFLFVAMGALFIFMTITGIDDLPGEFLNKLSRSTPIFFMVAAVYFENRFEFYDLVVKRGLLILLSVLVLGVFLAMTLPWLERLPGGAARPWLFAVALAPAAMVMPWLVGRIERWLDRAWLGREYTPVEAIKHVLAGMQPATDEASLVTATEARLEEIFGADVALMIGASAEPPAGAVVETEVAMATPSGEPIRIAVLKAAGTRRMLSEDLGLLRSLAGVFGFMLENLRLQRRRQEQDQLAQELRLQSSKSELKALRAQINPHFLFNALNAIASLIHTDPARADEAVEQLAEVFRYTLRRSDTEWAPLDQELTFARAYLDVEQARFGQRLTSSIDSDHQSPAPLIPSMLLQTLLENAVKHGVSQARGPGRIDVIVRSTPDRITIEVRNTGPSTRESDQAVARSGQNRDGEGFGLHSVRERLKGHFGDRASFRLMRDETAGVTIARIDMPPGRIAA